MLRAESLQASEDEKVEAYEQISATINQWMQEAIQASQEGQQYVMSPSIRVMPLIDCLINGLSSAFYVTPLSHSLIVTST